MKKDFDSWNRRKKELNEIESHRLHAQLAVLNKEKFREIKKTIKDLF